MAQVLPLEGRVQAKTVSSQDSLRIRQIIQTGVDTQSTDRTAAWTYFTQAERQAVAAGSVYLYADVLLQEAVLHYLESHYENAIQACELAATYFAESGALLKEVRCYSNLGLMYQYMGDYTQALRNLFKGLSLLQNTTGNSDLQGSLFANISIAYLDLNDFDNALAFAFKSEQINLQEKDTADLAGIYNTVADIYKNTHDYDKSIAYYKKSIDIHRHYGDEELAMASLANLAQVYLSKDDIDSALYIQGQTIEFATRHKDKDFSNYCFAITTYGYMLATAGKTDQAAKYLAGCLSCRPLLTNYSYAINYYSFLYQYYKSTGQLDLALANMEKLHEVGDSLNIASRKFENQRSAIRYEFDAKAKEDSLRYLLDISQQKMTTATYKNRMYLLLVALLVITGAAVAVIRKVRKVQQEKRQKALEGMRNTIASDLHDDIGSTLSSIQIISNLALKQCDGHPRLRQSVGQISSLSDKVSDGIREIVWSINPAHDQLKSIIQLMRKLAAELLSPAEIAFRVQTQIKDPDTLVSPQIRKDFLMIYKEAINNARKYSGSHQIDIKVEQSQETLTLEVSDHGQGFDIEHVLKGNGLDNMQRRADAIHGNLQIRSAPHEGTTLTLQVPLP